MGGSNEANLRRAEARIASVWKTLARDHAGADFSDGEPLRRWAGSPLPFINIVLPSPTPADKAAVRQSLHQAADYMRGRPQPGVIFICQDRLRAFAADELADVVAASGLRQGAVWMEMVGEVSAMASSSVPHPELRFTRIADQAGVRLLADINSEAYGLPLDAGRDGIEGECRLWTESFSFVAMRHDEPVSVCAYMVQDGCLYLAWVATRPGERKKGYASAVVSHALQQAHLATGIQPTDLHATEVGAPIYEKLGYRRSIAFQHFHLVD